MVPQIKNIKSKISGKISFNESLSKLSWFNLGGPAKVLFRPKNLQELSIFLKEIKEIKGINEMKRVSKNKIAISVFKKSKKFKEIKKELKDFKKFEEKKDIIFYKLI